MKEDLGKYTGNQYFALVYRSEMKKILINQINLVKITVHILERLMKGMTLDFAVTRVFELESKKEFIINRMMIDNYLTSLKKGLEKNQQEFVNLHKAEGSTDDVQAKMIMMEKQRKLRMELPRVAYRQFEVRGYDKMIERILEAPLKSSQNSQNKELEEKLLLIKDSLKEQVNSNTMYLEEQKKQEEKKGNPDEEEEGSEYDEEEASEYYDEEDDVKDDKTKAAETDAQETVESKQPLASDEHQINTSSV